MNGSEESRVAVRSARTSDAEALCRIYNHYVTETIVTFEEKPLSPHDMAERIGFALSSHWPWLVGERRGEVVGYACASPWKERSAYRFSSETTVYLAPDQVGQGLGTRLYQDILSILKGDGIHAAIGGIALPNAASVALHEKLGFTKVAHFSEVGYKFDRWIDVGYWERLL